MFYKPLVTIAAAHIVGILLCLVPCTTLIVVCIVLLCAVWILSKSWKHWLLHLSVVFLGWASAFVRTGNSVHAADWLVDTADAVVFVEGTVCTDADSIRLNDNGWICANFDIRFEGLFHHDASREETRGILHVLWYGNDWNNIPGYGEKWRFSGRLKKESVPVFITGSSSSEFLETSRGNSLVRACYAARRKAAEYLVMGINEQSQVRGILLAMLLGYRSQMSLECNEAFIDTGTLHIFAISGLHVGMIVTLIMFALKRLNISRIYWGLYMAPILIFYTFITGARASAVRACIMAVTYCLAPLFGRKPDTLCAMALSSIVILLWDPTQVLDLGFILSFTLVLGLVLLYPIFLKLLQKLDPPDEFETKEESLQKPGFARIFKKWLLSSIALSCSAWVTSVPLTAYFFGQLTPVALFANIIVIPMAYLIVLTGCLSMLAGAFVGLPAVLFGWINLCLVTVLLWLVSCFARIPFCNIEIGAMPVWSVLVWYIVLGSFVIITKMRSRLVI